MNDVPQELVLVCCILDYGQGSKALALAKEQGTIGETVFLGKGTVRNKFLNFLGALEIRKEILVAVSPGLVEDSLYRALIDRFELERPHKGIAFSLHLKQLTRIARGKQVSTENTKDVDEVGYEAIFVIVDKGLAPEVIEAAERAGSTGGTVIHGRGSGSQEKATLFNIEIEPEKDIVLILAKQSKSRAITKAIAADLKIEEPGAGIIFVLDVAKTVGLYEG